MIGFFIGVVLGLFYFGGLYLSVNKMNESKSPAMLMTLSFIFRMGILIGVFFYLSKFGYENMLFGLLGLILTRFILTFTLKNKEVNSKKRGD